MLLSERDVTSLLTMDEAISAVEEALKRQSSGKAVNCPRIHNYAGSGTYIATMMASDYQSDTVGFKVYTLAPGGVTYFVYLYDSERGDLVAILQANRLGQLRTGAASGIATRYMARQDASVVGLLGTGFQARTQLEAVCKVRHITSALVHSPTYKNRNTYASEMSTKLGIRIRPIDSPCDVVRKADILITATDSQTPVFEDEWIQPGTHISAVGGANPYVAEFGSAIIRRADLLVADDLAQLRVESGEFMMPATQGDILWEQIRELWQVVSGEIPGRRRTEDITLFKSLGMALWDISLAKAVYDKAIVHGMGKSIEG